MSNKILKTKNYEISFNSAEDTIIIVDNKKDRITKISLELIIENANEIIQKSIDKK